MRMISCLELADAEAIVASALLAAERSASNVSMVGWMGLALLSLQGVLHQPCALMAGGLVLRSQGVVVGAIGVSGMTPDQDTAIARAGAECFALRAQDCSS